MEEEYDYDYGVNVDPRFKEDIDINADKINDETLTEENASFLSEVSTNEKSKKTANN